VRHWRTRVSAKIPEAEAVGKLPCGSASAHRDTAGALAAALELAENGQFGAKDVRPRELKCLKTYGPEID
jgi:hypothetical protein